MTQNKDDSARQKISAEFAARLSGLRPEQKVRAIVLLGTKDGEKAPVQRGNATDRREIAEAMRRSAAQAMERIDKILEDFPGQRLATRPDVLGSIPIETTAAGIKALAASDWVKVVMEDQGIHPVV